MNIFAVNKAIKRLDAMVQNAMSGKPIENGFDETKMSALETSLAQYLMINRGTQTQLQEEKQRINQLISDISHQVKTPIANILLYAQLLEEGELQKAEKESVLALINQTEKLNFLIASLVKTSRLESGIISLVSKNSDIQPIIDDVILEAAKNAENKNIIINNQPTDIKVLCDPKWTAEAMGNILDNAIKYTPCGGSVSITVEAFQIFCKIDISDNGMGIREEEQAKIFTRFYRSDTVGEKDGVGLGLYLAREVISNEGGYIKVKSAPQMGSTFSVYLPLKN